MARQPRRSDVACARKAQRSDPPLRFVEDYDHVTPAQTTAYKVGMILYPPEDARAAALRFKKAVEHRG